MTRPSLPYAVVGAALLFVACEGDGPSAELVSRCEKLGQEGLARSARVVARTGSRLTGDSVLHVGEVPECDDDATATQAFVTVSELLAEIPEALAPAYVELHVAPALEQGARAPNVVEYHRPTRSLLVTREARSAPPTVWRHELAHVRMGRLLPPTPLGRGLLAAFEEGIADYYAAALSGGPRLGPFPGKPAAQRDLTRPEKLRPGDWEAIALGRLGFDPHRVGSVFGSLAWKAEPSTGPLLHGLIACMGPATGDLNQAERAPAHVKESPVAWLGPIILGCPPPLRPRLHSLLDRWLPVPLPR